MAFAVAAAVGEISVAGSFFLAPFALAAAASAVAAFAGVSVALEWVIFVAAAGASFAGLRPLSRRLDASSPPSAVGAQRWAGRQGFVVRDIPGGPGETGMIRLDREEWRAESFTGHPIRAGSTVLVSRVDGTRLVVIPLDEPEALASEGE